MLTILVLINGLTLLVLEFLALKEGNSESTACRIRTSCLVYMRDGLLICHTQQSANLSLPGQYPKSHTDIRKEQLRQDRPTSSISQSGRSEIKQLAHNR